MQFENYCVRFLKSARRLVVRKVSLLNVSGMTINLLIPFIAFPVLNLMKDFTESLQIKMNAKMEPESFYIATFECYGAIMTNSSKNKTGCCR